VGANDHLQAIALGTIQPIGSVFNTNTFYGALQASIEKILTTKPTMRVYLVTPIPGYYFDTTATYNNEGKLSVDYVNAIKTVGELYGCPVCDWYNNIGINSLNESIYLGDIESVTYDLHPTNALFARMGDYISWFLANN